MIDIDLDEIDMGILHLLQEDARNLTPVDMAERLPVTDGTVRNRIERMEEAGIIEGYVPNLNYEAAGFPLRIVFTCTAPVTERAELAEQILQTDGVIEVQELMKSRRNVSVVAVATETDRITHITTELHNLGLTVEDEELLRHVYTQPFNHFGSDVPG